MLGSRRPLVAAGFTILGGAFIAAGGFVLWAIGTILAHVVGLSSPLFLVGLLVGLVTIVAGVLMLAVPRAARGMGAVALACAVASIPFAFGGFVLGFVLTSVGGALALARPRRVVVVTGPAQGPSPPWT
jgi:Family of unknown function (DUF6114)